MNFIRNKLFTEEMYVKVVTSFVVTGTGVGIYEGVKESKRSYTSYYNKIVDSTISGISGAGIGFLLGTTSPIWMPICIATSGVYGVNFIYDRIM